MGSAQEEADIVDRFLQNVLMPAGITNVDNGEFRQWMALRTLAPREILLAQGQPWTQLFFILEGVVRLFYSDSQGNEFNKSFFQENQCVWPVTNRDRIQGALFHIAAIEKAKVMVLDIKELQASLSNTGQWQDFHLYYADQVLTSKFQREHDLLTLTAKQRYLELQRHLPQLLSRLPDYHLASYLGITNVSLSRLKSSIRNAN